MKASSAHDLSVASSTAAYRNLCDDEEGGMGRQGLRRQFSGASVLLSCLLGVAIGCFGAAPGKSEKQEFLPSGNPMTDSDALTLSASSPDLMLPIPSAKQLVNIMDTLIGEQFKWDDWKPWHAKYSAYFAENFTYDYGYPKPIDPNPCTLCHLDIPGTLTGLKQGDAPYHGIKSWWSGEHIPWNVAFPSSRFAAVTGFIFAGHEDKVTLTTYAKSFFVNDFKGIPHTPTATKRQELASLGIDANAPIPMTIVDLDFYHVGHDTNSGEQRILYNWCDGDLYGMMVQTGRVLLKPTGLPQGVWYPPRTMEGIPAPFSEFATPEKTREASAEVEAIFQKLFLGPASADDEEQYLKDLMTSDAVFYFNPYGIGFADKPATIVDQVLRPLIWEALSGKRVDFDMAFCESHVCGAHGQIVGNHIGDFMGVASKNKPEVHLRFGCHLILVKTPVMKMKDGYCIFELLGAVLEMGRNLVEEAQQYNASDLK
jgi:hypothetical protein